MKSLISSLVVSGLLATSAFATQVGSEWNEDGNAGRTVATSQVVTGSGPLTAINGRWHPDSTDVDFYLISLLGGPFSAVTADLYGDIYNPDPMLFLWDSAGNPLLFNDDTNGYMAAISGSFAAGNYILGISYFANGYGLHAADSEFTGQEGPANVRDATRYHIELEGASFSSVPDSGATIALLGFAMLSLAAVRRKLR